MRKAIVWGLTTLSLAATSASYAMEPLAPIFTAKREFRIPFHVDPPERPEQTPVQVELHSSFDQTNWTLAGKQPPEANGFQFTAPADGEYWFVVRTLDKQGQRLPTLEGPTEPELAVIVDSTPPVFDLEVAIGQAGEVYVFWQAIDEYLAIDRPEVEIMQLDQPGATWQTVAVNAGTTGQAVIPGLRGNVAVRARVIDFAGNAVARESKINTTSRTPVRGVPVEAGLPTWANVMKKLDPTPVAQAAPAEGHDTMALASAEQPPVAQPGAETTPLDLFEGLTQKQPATAPAAPPVPAAPKAPTGKLESGSTAYLPPGVTPDVVNSTSFAVEYDVNAIGPSGIAKVEMWGTVDGGKTWKLYSTDEDCRSPIELNVTREATYGFQLVVQTGAGLGGEPPQPGQLPSIWITVDSTKPAAKLKSITNLAAENSPGDVLITWEASDRQLAPKPVSLYYSSSPQGPWFPIAMNLENSGEYRWRVGQRIPRQLHLRLDVRDTANNLGQAFSGDGAIADQMRPQVQVRSAKAIPAERDPRMLR